MATQATSTGPIVIFQINHTYFVGDDGYNIQQTVNFAVADGNAGTVVIPQEYTGTDAISAVTGGSTTVYLMDERGGQRQAYLWLTNAYVAEPILPIGIGTPQINHQLFVGPLGKFPTIQSAITFANGGKYAIIIPQTYAGSEDIATLTGGAASVYISDQRTYQWQNYYWTGTQYVPIIFTPQGAVSFPAGITGPLTVNGVATVTDSIATPMITADTADFTAIECETLDSSDTITGNAALFETCLVENSPVRTFANTGDPDTGMSFPPAGIGVSTGTAWDDDSIDPATLAIWPPVGVPVSTGTAWDDDSIDPATLAIWPPVGVPVSTGTAWGFSIPANTIPRLNMANIFTGLNTFASVIVNQSFQATMNNGSNPPVVAPSAGGFALGWNSQPGNGETDFINSNGGAGGGFNWYNVGGGTSIGPTTTPSMILDSSNSLHVAGNYSAAGYITAANIIAATSINSSITLGAQYGGYPTSGVAGQPYGRIALGVVGQTGVAFPGVFTVNTTSSLTTSSVTDTLDIRHQSAGPEGGSPVLWSLQRTGNMFVTGSITAGTSYRTGPLIGGNQGANLDYYGDGLRLVSVNTIPSTAGSYGIYGYSSDFTQAVEYVHCYQDGGGFHVAVNAIFTATQKNFRIAHPLDETKDLIHSCLEGPEIAVFYRGEAVTKDGIATITLPDYFEALTAPTDRTVQLTQIFEDDSKAIIGSNKFSMLMASRVKDGKFKIRSSEPIAKVWWEVKAIRADQPALKVTVEKEKSFVIPNPTAADAGTDRDRAPETGESKPKKVRA